MAVDQAEAKLILKYPPTGMECLGVMVIVRLAVESVEEGDTLICATKLAYCNLICQVSW